ncbi:MAG: YbjN domain-containing protein [Nitrospinaceae bacterium]
MSNFEKVKDYLLEMGFSIDHEDSGEELVVVNDEERGIHHLVLDCEDPILILEQVIMPLPEGSAEVYKRLLEINRTLVHGAFALDEEGGTLIFRDTLQLENLDRNELEGSIDALSLAMAEHGGELLSFSRSK